MCNVTSVSDPFFVFFHSDQSMIDDGENVEFEVFCDLDLAAR